MPWAFTAGDRRPNLKGLIRISHIARVRSGGLALALAAIAVAGCGGGSSSKSSGGDKTTTQSIDDAAGVRLGTRAGARVADPSNPDAKYTPTVKAKAGDTVQVRATVRDKKPLYKARMDIKIPKKRAKSLKVTVGGYKSKAKEQAKTTIQSTGKPIRVSGVRYTCDLSSHTFCPVDLATQNDKGYEVVLKPPDQDIPVVLSLSLSGKKAG